MIPIFISAEGTLPLLLRALSLLDSQYQNGYRLTLFSAIILILLVIGVIVGFVWLVWKDIKSKKLKTGFEILIGKEAEVTTVSSSGKTGWILYEGENWKFFSIDKVKEGDIVAILSYKRMILSVKKIEDSYE